MTISLRLRRTTLRAACTALTAVGVAAGPTVAPSLAQATAGAPRPPVVASAQFVDTFTETRSAGKAPDVSGTATRIGGNKLKISVNTNGRTATVAYLAGKKIRRATTGKRNTIRPYNRCNCRN